MSYKISPSSANKFYQKGTCKRNWYEKNVARSIERDPPSNQMIKGTLFETLATGENVGGSELPPHDFLYTKTGKSVELVRIEQQAEKFKSLVNPLSDDYLGFIVKGKQVQVENEYMRGVIDIVGETDFEETVINDIKFTADVESTFGDYAWGRNPSEIDWSQIASYKRMWQDNFESEKGPKTNLLAFDATPRMGVKFFDIKLSDNYVDNVIEKARYVVDYVDRVRNEDVLIETSVVPSKDNCEGCPLECVFRFKQQNVDKIKVYV